MKHELFTSLLMALAISSQAQQAPISITIDSETDNIAISPYMYGRNGAPSSTAEYSLIKEAGIRFERMNDGNNCTKYNWRKKLTCHPDWYNNVYDCDWDKRASDFQANLPNLKGMFAFQLLGKVAKTKDYNFNDWGYNRSQWWSGCSKKMCGGGSFDENGNVVQLGDTSLFLQDWPADSTVGIYNHWKNDLNLDMSQFEYWNMDNEMEIWGGTHSDVITDVYTNETYEEIMQKYFAVAKAIRKINPNVKLCGPAAASEWTWYNGCGNTQPTVDGKTYSWLEYFIMRCAQEEKATGVRMIDVLDIHNYPEVSTEAQMLQTHRMFYDKNYNYPGANGVKKINGGWDNSQTKEYIFERCKDWIIEYFGSDNGITFGVGEYNIKSTAKQMTQALSYASCIGEGSRHGMEYFTPWTWYDSMWEVVHLFSSCAKEINVGAVSSDEKNVSAYTSKNSKGDSITIIFVNRSDKVQNALTQVLHTKFQDGVYTTYTLQNLPETKTFNSHTSNALETGTIELTGNTLGMSLPAYSITAVILGNGETSVNNTLAKEKPILYPNPASQVVNVSSDFIINNIELYNTVGTLCKSMSCNARQAKLTISGLPNGIYVVMIHTTDGIQSSLLNVRAD